MFKYMTAQEAAELWKISVRHAQRLCKGNRIDGAININRIWLVPRHVKNPIDIRTKQGKHKK